MIYNIIQEMPKYITYYDHMFSQKKLINMMFFPTNMCVSPENVNTTFMEVRIYLSIEQH